MRWIHCFLFLGFFTVIHPLTAQVVTIGTGTASQYAPFDLFGGYARSAAIYTASEIGTSGLITHLGWEVATADIETCPVRIYLKQTPTGSLTAVTWSSLTGQAKLVFEGLVNFAATGWKTIDIADFVYLNTSGENLLVLCEANFGGNGAMGYPFFAFSYAEEMHETWQQYETPPIEGGLPDDNRPNIQVTLAALSTPHPPSGFIAQSGGTNLVNLEWKKNTAGNNVMVAFNTTDVFGTPAGSYSPGNPVAGGGTVIYNGVAETFQHTAGLSPATTYYYKAWSVLPPAPAYSDGVASAATTGCNATGNYPLIADFESTEFPPVCWSIARKPWVRDGTLSAFGTGSGAIFADFFNASAGNTFDLILPVMDLSGLPFPEFSFDHAYATYSGETDQLQMWISGDGGDTWALHYTWDGGSSGPLNTGSSSTVFFIPNSTQWGTQGLPIPAGTNRIRLRGVSAWGNALYLDNIKISDQALTWNGSVSDQWMNAANWTPGEVPVSTRNVILPAGQPRYPLISATGPVCHNLLMNSGSTLIIQTGCTLVTTGNLTIGSGATLTNNGVLQIQGDLVNQNP